jgi:hypothetical protein
MHRHNRFRQPSRKNIVCSSLLLLLLDTRKHGGLLLAARLTENVLNDIEI